MLHFFTNEVEGNSGGPGQDPTGSGGRRGLMSSGLRPRVDRAARYPLCAPALCAPAPANILLG